MDIPIPENELTAIKEALFGSNGFPVVIRRSSTNSSRPRQGCCQAVTELSSIMWQVLPSKLSCNGRPTRDGRKLPFGRTSGRFFPSGERPVCCRTGARNEGIANLKLLLNMPQPTAEKRDQLSGRGDSRAQNDSTIHQYRVSRVPSAGWLRIFQQRKMGGRSPELETSMGLLEARRCSYASFVVLAIATLDKRRGILLSVSVARGTVQSTRREQQPESRYIGTRSEA